MGKDVIIACDFSSREECLQFLDLFPDEEKPYVKVGMELFYAEGAPFLRELKARGHRIFLDLKLHDIPNTVQKAMRVLARHEVDMCNLHAAGTVRMMEAALCGLEEGSEGRPRPLLIAVTQLTSTDQARMETEIGIEKPMEEVVSLYAAHAKRAGLDGVVCSPREAALVHARLGETFLTVTPGVRFPEEAHGDQARVMSPADAGKAGSDYIVMGRSVTAAKDPLAAYRRARRDFCGE